MGTGVAEDASKDGTGLSLPAAGVTLGAGVSAGSVSPAKDGLLGALQPDNRMLAITSARQRTPRNFPE